MFQDSLFLSPTRCSTQPAPAGSCPHRTRRKICTERYRHRPACGACVLRGSILPRGVSSWGVERRSPGCLWRNSAGEDAFTSSPRTGQMLRPTQQGESVLEGPDRLRDPRKERRAGGRACLKQKRELPQLPPARLGSRWQGWCPELGPTLSRRYSACSHECVCTDKAHPRYKGNLESILLLPSKRLLPCSWDASLGRSCAGKSSLPAGCLSWPMPTPTELLETPDRLL